VGQAATAAALAAATTANAVSPQPGGQPGIAERPANFRSRAPRTAPVYITEPLNTTGYRLAPDSPLRPQVLYHYATPEAIREILRTQVLFPSIRAANPRDARYGDGQYFSNIAPGQRTNNQLSATFVRWGNQGHRFSHYVAVNVSGLDLVVGRPGVFLVPNAGNLPLAGRIVGFGINQR
jgi:hypothetical protein